MARHEFSDEEVRQWEEEHHQTVIYINKDDSNLFVRRYLMSGAWTLNLANPVAWIIVAAFIALIVGINFGIRAMLR